MAAAAAGDEAKPNDSMATVESPLPPRRRTRPDPSCTTHLTPPSLPCLMLPSTFRSTTSDLFLCRKSRVPQICVPTPPGRRVPLPEELRSSDGGVADVRWGWHTLKSRITMQSYYIG
ncbi:uncharacterized protein G2W53_025819 [Senna tora]|uniref:Uncharacterized protein n=1 Tax=Senna tora TaxID=362788 RepID=A0A834TMW7_9FABA|nr:uncharacterized protein G2W53_025819 [Senna tora]